MRNDIQLFLPLWGKWQLESLIGEGSYGRVYKMYREELGERFYSAVKRISLPADREELDNLYEEGLAENESSALNYYHRMAETLLEEIRLMLSLRGNTNIVSCEDYLLKEKEDMPGYDLFIRMELLTSMSQYMQRNKLAVDDVKRLGEDLCTALMLLESRNIVHRDIKPQNIFLNQEGSYKLGDFGVARRMGEAATVMSKKGTFAYMAPEIYKGDKADTTSDIYSLGLVMYRLMNRNRAPFLPQDTDMVDNSMLEEALRRRIAGEALPPPAFASEELSTVVLKACAYRPKDRYQTAAEMKAALTGRAEEPSPKPVVDDLSGKQSFRDTPIDATKGMWSNKCSNPEPSPKPQTPPVQKEKPSPKSTPTSTPPQNAVTVNQTMIQRIRESGVVLWIDGFGTAQKFIAAFWLPQLLFAICIVIGFTCKSISIYFFISLVYCLITYLCMRIWGLPVGAMYVIFRIWLYVIAFVTVSMIGNIESASSSPLPVIALILMHVSFLAAFIINHLERMRIRHAIERT